jgi:hypothetical protein
MSFPRAEVPKRRYIYIYIYIYMRLSSFLGFPKSGFRES